jgi:hypothetical protein
MLPSCYTRGELFYGFQALSFAYGTPIVSQFFDLSQFTPMAEAVGVLICHLLLIKVCFWDVTITYVRNKNCVSNQRASQI